MNLVKILDPNLKFNEDKYFACLMGGKTCNPRQYPFSSGGNINAILNTQTESPLYGLSRKWNFKLPVTIDFTGNSNDASRNLLQSGYDAFRSFPIQSIIRSLTIGLNNQQRSIDLNTVFKPLAFYHNNNRNLGERNMSKVPTYLDQSQEYSQLEGAIRNPLNSYYDSNARDSMGRGAFPYDSFSNTTTTAQIVATLENNLCISPLQFGSNEEIEDFIGVQNISITVTYDSNLSKIWSHSSASSSTISTVTITLGIPTLEIVYKIPFDTMSIPKQMPYSYNEIIEYITTSPILLGSGVQQTLTLNNIQLTAIPRFIYIWGQKSVNDQTYTDTDSFLSIENINIAWQGQTGLFSEASQQQLYDICAKNGVDFNYSQWSGKALRSYVGNQTDIIRGPASVLCLEFGTDIQLNEGECVGMRGTYNLRVTVSATNRRNAAFVPEYYICCVTPGIFWIDGPSSASQQLGIGDKLEVLNAPMIKGIDYEDMERNLMMGGNKFSRGVSKILRKSANIGKIVAQDAYDIGKDVIRARLTNPAYQGSASVMGGTSVLGGYGTKKGARKNPWLSFVKKNKGKGYSLADLSKMYKSGSSSKSDVKKRKCKKFKKTTAMSKNGKKYKTKRCAKYGGELISKQDLMNRYMDMV
jgi:hypothetical protein